MNVNDIILALKLCLEATDINFRGQFYPQIYGTAIGSSVSMIVANVVMETIEEKALTTFSHPLRFWARYVNDTSAIIFEETY